jgi:hypothetical protein
MKRNFCVGTKDKDANGILIGHFGNMEVANTRVAGSIVYDRPYLIPNGSAVYTVSLKWCQTRENSGEIIVPAISTYNEHTPYFLRSPISHSRSWR